MLLAIKPICPKSKARKDGTSIIFLQYCGAGDKKTLLNTEIAIPPRWWLKRSKNISDDLPECYGSAITLNEQLITLKRKAEDIIKYGIKTGITDLVDFVKATFCPDFDLATLGANETEEHPFIETVSTWTATVPAIRKVTTGTAPVVPANNYATDLDLYVQFEDYMKSKKKKVTPRMMNVYKNTKDLLFAFEVYRGKKITFDCFDYNFYDHFVDFLTYDYEQRRRKTVIKGLKRSSIGKTIKQLRIFLRDRIRRKIIAPIDLSDYKILDEESDAIYLTPHEINRIYQADLSEHPHLDLHRNLLVLGCLTGMRFSDFSSINPEDIKGDMLHKKQQKSDGWVVIPLRPKAYEILVNRFKGRIPKTSNPEFNRHIKTVGQLAGIRDIVKFSYKKGNQDIVVVKPKFEWITSHTCRRSFCTNEFLAGTPVELIMKISGHKSLRDFYRYIRITPEEAGIKIKEIWMEREKERAKQQVTISA